MSSMCSKFRLFTLFSIFICLALIEHTESHGIMLYPNTRGALSSKARFHISGLKPIPGAENTKIDDIAYFPSGKREPGVEGAGRQSQIKEVKRTLGRWVPYDPYSPTFQPRAGICGDTVTGNEHLKGGEYYNNGMVAANFSQGQVIDVQVGFVYHHNGFMELHVCDVEKCANGDISLECFRQGHCEPLKRVADDRCQSRLETDCAPVDPNYPSRWYLPCREYGRNMTIELDIPLLTYGPDSIKYQLPQNLSCEHCVLQWYWVAGNNCNAPGVREFYTGSHGPLLWGECPGNSNAKGGYLQHKEKDCGGEERIPEEYYQCSDIRISPATTQPPSASEKPKKLGKDGVKDLVLVRNGLRGVSLRSDSPIKYDQRSEYTIEALVADHVDEVRFIIRKGEKGIIDQTVPRNSSGSSDRIYLFGTISGTTYPTPWTDIPRNKVLRVIAIATDLSTGQQDRDTRYFKFDARPESATPSPVY